MMVFTPHAGLLSLRTQVRHSLWVMRHSMTMLVIEDHLGRVLHVLLIRFRLARHDLLYLAFAFAASELGEDSVSLGDGFALLVVD